MRQNLPHWNYFRILEKDLEQCFQYVDPVESHFSVHSDQFSKLILVACSEIENALRSLSLAIDQKSRVGNLGSYRDTVIHQYPNFWRMKFSLPRYNLSFCPWMSWKTENASPDWWKEGYNKIKHDRVGNPGSATLYAAISSVSALEAVLMHLYRFKYQAARMPFECAPHLIYPAEEGNMGGAEISWSWELPDDPLAVKKRGDGG